MTSKLFITIGICTAIFHTCVCLFLDPKDFDVNTWFPVPSGARQSPINIELLDAVTVPYFHPIRITNLYRQPDNIQVKHVGETVKYIPNYSAEMRPILHGGPLQGRFVLEHIHFHWGAVDTVGSEHTLDRNQYSMEMHIVFYNMQYPTLAEAMVEKNGLAVMGFLFQTNEKAMQQAFSKSLAAVKMPDAEVTLTGTEAFSLGELLGSTGWDYASYLGSLTTEPFSETVTWLVNLNPIGISPTDMDTFRHLLRPDGTPLVNNYRELQPLAGRHVELYFEGY